MSNEWDLFGSEPEPGKLWTTQTGEELDPEDFEDRHLLNTIKYIERLQAQDPGSFGGGDPDDSDGAYFAKESEERHNDILRELLAEAHEALTVEAKERGLLGDKVNDLASTNSKPTQTHTKSAQSDPKRKANT